MPDAERRAADTAAAAACPAAADTGPDAAGLRAVAGAPAATAADAVRPSASAADADPPDGAALPHLRGARPARRDARRSRRAPAFPWRELRAAQESWLSAPDAARCAAADWSAAAASASSDAVLRCGGEASAARCVRASGSWAARRPVPARLRRQVAARQAAARQPAQAAVLR